MASPNYGNMYAKHGHDHDLVYSKHTHSHDNDYSKIYHNHDGVYAQKSHNHNGTYLPLTGGTVNGDVVANTYIVSSAPNVKFGYQESSGDTFVSNANSSWLRLKPDNSMTYAGKSVLINQGRQTLWSGGWYMLDNQTVTPSKALSACQNGWVMIWCDYDPATSTSNDYNYVFHYIHKNSYLSGKNSLWSCPCDGGDNKDFTKWLYITDTNIKGHSGNGSGNGNDIILKYVMEW